MDYNHITKFLENFKKLIFQKEEIKRIVKEIISTEINHPVDDEQIKIKDVYIYISGSPIFRNEIMLHKKQILIRLKELVPNTNFLDIK